MDTIIKLFQPLIPEEIRSFEKIVGGSINKAGYIQTDLRRYFFKINDYQKYPKMFAAEVEDLNLLSAQEVIRTPKVIREGHIEDHAFLLLEYIEKGIDYKSFWDSFGRQLGDLHRKTNETFGLDRSNYIGSLKQENNAYSDFVTFFVECRIEPQYQLAKDKGFFNKQNDQQLKRLFKMLPSIIPEEVPSLIHGDLWSGNFMVSNNGEAVLVDPSVSYAHREMDLAMSVLFGGFNEWFYESYEAHFPTAPGLENRIQYYHLYYLLVHVNLFGGAYTQSVQHILSKF